MKFTLNRNMVVTSTLGHAIGFEKDVPTYVPPEMYRAVRAVGAIPEEDFPEEEQNKVVRAPTDPDERQEVVFGAFEQLVKTNEREDFNGSGVPTSAAIQRLVGFKLDDKSRVVLWRKFTQRKAE